MKHLHIVEDIVVLDVTYWVLEDIEVREINGFNFLVIIKKMGIWLNPQSYEQGVIVKDLFDSEKEIYKVVNDNNN